MTWARFSEVFSFLNNNVLQMGKNRTQLSLFSISILFLPIKTDWLRFRYESVWHQAGVCLLPPYRSKLSNCFYGHRLVSWWQILTATYSFCHTFIELRFRSVPDGFFFTDIPHHNHKFWAHLLSPGTFPGNIFHSPKQIYYFSRR